MMTKRVWYVLALLLSSAACGEATQKVTSHTDSLGTRHTVSADAALSFAKINPDPVLSLGGADAKGPTQFFRVRGVHVDFNENLWVADGGSNEVRIFRPDGSHWLTVGGRGEGPGEFQRIQILSGFRRDSVAVWDRGNARLTVYDEFGSLVRNLSGKWGDNPIPSAVAVFPDGSLLAKKPIMLWAGSIDPGQVIGDTVSLIRVDLEERTEKSIGLAYGPLWVFTGTNQIAIPFTINSPIAIQGEEVHLAEGAAFRIQVFRDGRLSEEYGVDRPPRVVTGESVEAYANLFEGIPDPGQRSELLSTIDHPARPDHLPSYERLIVAADGNVWAQIYTPARSGVTWDVFAPSREWLGQVELPSGFSPFVIRDQRLVGVWRDELGVEHIRAYELDPAAG